MPITLSQVHTNNSPHALSIKHWKIENQQNWGYSVPEAILVSNFTKFSLAVVNLNQVVASLSRVAVKVQQTKLLMFLSLSNRHSLNKRSLMTIQTLWISLITDQR